MTDTVRLPVTSRSEINIPETSGASDSTLGEGVRAINVFAEFECKFGRPRIWCVPRPTRLEHSEARPYNTADRDAVMRVLVTGAAGFIGSPYPLFCAVHNWNPYSSAGGSGSEV